MHLAICIHSIMTLTLHSLLCLQKWTLPAGWSTVKSAAFNYCVLMELVSPATGASNYSASVDLLSPPAGVMNNIHSAG
jgi:hypothetical protein